MLPNQESLHLRIWLLTGSQTEQVFFFLKEQPHISLDHLENLQVLFTMQNGQYPFRISDVDWEISTSKSLFNS